MTNVENIIYTDSSLSALDEVLSKIYKTKLSESSHYKEDQKLWLMKRNRCTDKDCVLKEYNDRINELQSFRTATKEELESNNIIAGRCHMEYCWWQKIDKIDIIRASDEGELIRASLRVTDEINYPNGNYPDKFPINKKIKWNEPDKEYIFCSRKLPLWIKYNEKEKKYTGTIPFDEDGDSSGATEGISHLFDYVCKRINSRSIGIDGKTKSLNTFINMGEIILNNPEDVFDLINQKISCNSEAFPANHSLDNFFCIN